MRNIKRELKMLKQYCKCNCDQEIIPSKGNPNFKYYSQMYINGHNRRNKRPWNRLVLQKSSQKLTPELAYVLGVCYGDGHLSNVKKAYSVSLGAIDKEFVLFFKNQIEKWSKIKCNKLKLKEDDVYNKNKYYFIRLTSIEVVNFLKLFNLNNLKESSKKCKSAFLKGIYDSEGHIYTSKNVYAIDISNQNKNILQLCKDLLLDLKIESRPIRVSIKKGYKNKLPNKKIYINKKNCYVFMICGKNNILEFNKMIKFTIKRKQKILDNKINSYLTKKQLSFMHSLPFYQRPNWKKLYNKEHKLKISCPIIKSISESNKEQMKRDKK